jgi:hypothetical protein
MADAIGKTPGLEMLIPAAVQIEKVVIVDLGRMTALHVYSEPGKQFDRNLYREEEATGCGQTCPWGYRGNDCLGCPAIIPANKWRAKRQFETDSKVFGFYKVSG